MPFDPNLNRGKDRGNDLVERVRSALDIVDVAQTYFPVTRRGASFIALCPFHREKTPSFHLHTARQTFKCFGCQKGGDIFTLVMEIDKLSFREALKVLAQRAGIPVSDYENPRFAKAEEKRLKLFTILKHAEEFYRDQLRGSAGTMARDYLARRGFSKDAIESFGIGFAPAEWRALLTHLLARGHAEEDTIRAGVIKHNEEKGRSYDLLRRRIVIPIRDSRGRCVAFGGRVLDDAPEDSGPKYLNTGETELFSKRQVLFGFDRARDEASQRGAFVVVEGYLDVIASHQHGARNVVATLGTSLTGEHAQILRRYASRVVLLFDPDEGGQRGTDRGAAILLREGFDVRVGSLPDGLDPDEYLEKHGLVAFQAFLAEKTEELVEYLVRRARERALSNEGGDAASARAAREVLQFLGQIADPLQRDLLAARVAREFGLDETVVRRTAAEMVRAESRNENRSATGHFDDESSSQRLGPAAPLAGWEQDEVFALHGALTCAKLACRAAQELTESDFRDPGRQRVLNALIRLVDEGTTPAPSLLAEVLKEDIQAALALSKVVAADVPDVPGDDSLGRAMDALIRRRKDFEYKKLRDEATKSGALRSSDDSEVERQLEELSRFQAERYQRLKDARRGRAEGG